MIHFVTPVVYEYDAEGYKSTLYNFFMSMSTKNYNCVLFYKNPEFKYPEQAFQISGLEVSWNQVPDSPVLMIS